MNSIRALLVLTMAAGSARADDVVSTEVWGNGWMAGGYHSHDLQLSERVGLSLDWQGTAIQGLSLSYAAHFDNHVVHAGASAEAPLSFRVSLRGWELFEANTDRDDASLFTFDRIRDRESRRQLISISVSKRF